MRPLLTILSVLLLAGSAHAQYRCGTCYRAPVYKPPVYNRSYDYDTTYQQQRYTYTYTNVYNFNNAEAGATLPTYSQYAIPEAVKVEQAVYEYAQAQKYASQGLSQTGANLAALIDGVDQRNHEERIAVQKIERENAADLRLLGELRTTLRELRSFRETSTSINLESGGGVQGSVGGEAVPAEQVTFLNQSCYACHGGGGKVKGGFDLTQLDKVPLEKWKRAAELVMKHEMPKKSHGYQPALDERMDFVSFVRELPKGQK